MLIRIGALSEQTGVSADVLRSWERRYGLLRPARTEGGFRLYSEADVDRIRAMTGLLATGLSASDAARQVLATLNDVSAGATNSRSTPLEAVRRALHDAFRSFDEAALEAAVDLVLSRLDLDMATREVFLPALRSLGEDWAAGTVSIAQEHFSLNVFRGRLMGLARGWDQGFGPRALLACPPGEYHDVSLLLFGLALHRRGWRVTFLGANTPVSELLDAQRLLSSQITVLFAMNWADFGGLVPELSGLADTSFALAGAGAGAIAAAAGCRVLSGDPVSEAENLTREVRETWLTRRVQRKDQ